MPPVNQGSRSALVAWVVISSIVAVVTTILAIMFYVESSQVTDQSNALQTQLTEVVDAAIIRGQADQIEKLRSIRQDPARGLEPNAKLFNVAISEVNRLAKLIGGAEDEAAATAAAKAAAEKAKTALENKPAGDNLAANVEALIAQVGVLKTEAGNNKRQADESRTQLTQVVAANEAQISRITQSMAQLQVETNAAMNTTQTTTQLQSQGFETAAGELRKQLQEAIDQINQVNSSNGELTSQIEKQRIELIQLRQRLGENRVDPNQAIVRQPDGKIIQIAPNNVCFIDLGTGDRITQGLTFEVYDKFDGIPALGSPDNDVNLPIGKATLEVISVGPATSECRIIRRSLGTTLTEGDLISNLIYDRHTKYNFVIYGNFDLDQNGVATVQDAEVIKRLITSWGGTIMNEINVDTDFVVLGREPVVPEPPAEPGDALERALYDQAVAAADAYQDISQRAREFRLPILNQNRFLYMVGQYNSIRR